MCCLRDQLQEVVDAGHPDTAMVAITIGAARELLAGYKVDVVDPCAIIGLDLATNRYATTNLRAGA